jgi:hypothetical protein
MPLVEPEGSVSRNLSFSSNRIGNTGGKTISPVCLSSSLLYVLSYEESSLRKKRGRRTTSSSRENVLGSESTSQLVGSDSDSSCSSMDQDCVTTRDI